MKSFVSVAAFALLLATSLLAGQRGEGPARTARTDRSDELAEELEQMREDYRRLQAECWGRGYYLYEPGGTEVWHLSEAPDPESCKGAEALKQRYRTAYKALLNIDRKRVIFDDIPKYVDRS